VRRIQLLLAALAIVVASFGALSGPAVANDWNNNRWDDNWNNNWRWNNDRDDSWRWNNNWDDGWRWNNNWWWNSEVRDCPFWGDTEGIVNQWDCLD
jgi:hypothetical protein